MRNLCTLFICLFFVSCTQYQNESSPEAINAKPTAEELLTAKLDSVYKAGEIIGFGVAIADEKGKLYSRGFGYADKTSKTAYTENTIQHIASVSKTLIGISLLKAQELGMINLDDPVNQHLPFSVKHSNYPNDTITIRHLATHTSGINDADAYMENAWIIAPNQDLSGIDTSYRPQRFNTSSKMMTMEAYLKSYLVPGSDLFNDAHFTEFAPGAKYNYSNIGATLAALVLEQATGQAFDQFTEEHILQPLGMNATGWSLNDVDVSKHSRLYRSDLSLLPFYTAITYPDGMLITSSNDMATYLSELIKGFSGTGTLLSKESYQEFFRTQLKADQFIERDENHPYDGDYDPAIFIGHSALGNVGHSGGDAGVATWMYFNKEQKTGRFIMVNTDLNNRKDELEYYAIWDIMKGYTNQLR